MCMFKVCVWCIYGTYVECIYVYARYVHYICVYVVHVGMLYM